MSKKVLAIIGAGEGALPIINAAKEMGVTVVAYGRNDSLAKDQVDVFVEENNFDIQFIADSCRELGVNGVMPSSELSTEVAARVAREAGLLGNDVAHGFGGKNKYFMRTKVAGLTSVKQPEFKLYEDGQDFSFPVVVKSVDACGKRGVSIAYNNDDLKQAVLQARENSSDGSALVEEYLKGGQEYSIECLSNGKGQHQVIQYTEKESAGPPHFVEIAHHQPANLSDGMKARIDKVAWDILEVLGLNCGMAHLEVKIIDNEIYFIEVGARGGGDHISDILTPLSTGFDYYKAAIECHLGIYEPMAVINKAYTGIYFHSKQNERLKPLFEQAKTADWCIKNTVVDDDFAEASGNVGASNSGYIIYCSDHRITIKDYNMQKTEKKRLLLLGSSIWIDIIKKFAEDNNVELIFAGLYPALLDNIVKEYYRIDTTDRESMIPFIKSLNVDGIFMGGSETIVSHACEYVNELGYPCYCTKEQWDMCQNKQAFKNMCREYGVPCVPEFSQEDDPSTFDYPIIVKPTDSCSAKGISVCYNEEEYKKAIRHALEYSTEKKFIIEKFIENKGTTMSVRYIAVDGELYLEAVGDRYVLNPDHGKALITAAAFYPSKYTEQYIRTVDEKVKAMFKGIGIKNGAFFMESIANPDGIWFYEMGLRVSGGQTYKITEQTCGVNELKMLINYSCTGKMCDKEVTKKIDPYLNGSFSASLTIPLREGTIAAYEGLDPIRQISEIGEIVQYWKPGDTIQPKHIGTLDQLFCRIPIIVKGKDRLAEIMQSIKKMLSVKDTEGEEMIIWSKYDEIYKDFLLK